MNAACSREYPARPICGVGAVVFRADAVLLIRRGNPPRRGEWALPGGAVELGETWRDAARREVREECGIEIILGEVVDAVDIVQPDVAGKPQYHYAIVDFCARYAGGELRATSDALDARWVPVTEIAALALPPLTQNVIARAIQLNGSNL